MPSQPTKDRILDAYEHLLVNGGSRAATLDAVAAAGGGSKGGLLYHFGSTAQLRAGLLSRLTRQGDLDVERMKAAPEGAAWYFIRTSMDTNSDFDRAIVAASSIAFESDKNATAALEYLRTKWFGVLRDELGDEALARTIALLGHGIYFDAITGLTDRDTLSDVSDVLQRLGIKIDYSKLRGLN